MTRERVRQPGDHLDGGNGGCEDCWISYEDWAAEGMPECPA